MYQALARRLRFLNFLFRPKHEFKKLESIIGYRFLDPTILNQAFTHRSIDPTPRKNYERLEFLGDAVIDIVISKELMKEYPAGDEGLLTQKRAALVQKSFLANMGSLLNLLDFLTIDPTVNLEIDKIADRQNANCYEALVGAIFLDNGIDPCRIFIIDTVWRHREEAWKSTNYKGRLIEYCHSLSIGNPRFQITSVTGPEHQKMFEVHVKIGEETYPPGLGSNKKTAEQSAAQNALDTLQGNF